MSKDRFTRLKLFRYECNDNDFYVDLSEVVAVLGHSCENECYSQIVMKNGCRFFVEGRNDVVVDLIEGRL